MYVSLNEMTSIRLTIEEILDNYEIENVKKISKEIVEFIFDYLDKHFYKKEKFKLRLKWKIWKHITHRKNEN